MQTNQIWINFAGDAATKRVLSVDWHIGESTLVQIHQEPFSQNSYFAFLPAKIQEVSASPFAISTTTPQPL